MCKVSEDMDNILLCSLREGGTESQSLDLIFDSYTEFRVVGDASVHLTGYYMKEGDGVPRALLGFCDLSSSFEPGLNSQSGLWRYHQPWKHRVSRDNLRMGCCHDVLHAHTPGPIN